MAVFKITTLNFWNVSQHIEGRNLVWLCYQYHIITSSAAAPIHPPLGKFKLQSTFLKTDFEKGHVCSF
jgi:hypothetical protein